MQRICSALRGYLLRAQDTYIDNVVWQDGTWRNQRGANMFQTILRLPAVKQTTGLSRSTIYLKLSRGEFPSPVTLGARSVGWLQSDIQAWITARVQQSRPNAK